MSPDSNPMPIPSLKDSRLDTEMATVQMGKRQAFAGHDAHNANVTRSHEVTELEKPLQYPTIPEPIDESRTNDWAAEQKFFLQPRSGVIDRPKAREDPIGRPPTGGAPIHAPERDLTTCEGDKIPNPPPRPRNSRKRYRQWPLAGNQPN